MNKKYDKEIESLEKVYLEIVEAINNKPETQDYEASRIYFENVAARLNNWALAVKDVRRMLESRDSAPDLSTYNPPA